MFGLANNKYTRMNSSCLAVLVGFFGVIQLASVQAHTFDKNDKK